MPYPLPLTRTEAYLAYKAGVVQLSDLKPSLAVPRNGIDAWLAYWTGLAEDYPKREDGTPHILQEEEAYIAYLCGVVNEYPEKCLRRVGAYLRYLISARWGRPDRPLNREELYLSLIKTQVIPSGDPSSDIVIDGTAKAPFVDIKMYGDTFQQSYTGKNLLGLKNPSSNTFGFEPVVAEESGTITVNGTFTGGGGGFPWISDRQLSIPAGTYTFSMKNPQSFNVSLRMFDAQGQYTSGKYIAAGATSGTFTLEYDCVRVAILIGAFSAGKTLDNQKFEELQLEAGSTASNFEPYVGGQPSPSPEYPQPIQTVTGLQTVEVQGKNLFRAKDGQYRDNTLTVDVENGVIHVYGYQHASYDQNVWIPVEDIHADGTYTLTMNYSGSGGGAFRLTKDKSYQAANNFGGTYYSPNRGTPVTASATNITYNWVLIYLGHGSSLSEVDYYINPQFESGSLSTYFSPYSKQTLPISLGSIELCKLGTYQDYIYKDGDDWKVHKNCKTITLNGSEDWQYSSTYDFFYAGAISGMEIPVNAGVACYCRTHKGLTSSSSGPDFVTEASDYPYAVNVHTTQALTRIKDTRFSSTQDLAAWLAQNNTTIYYVVRSATDTTITDTNLIAQLDSLVNGGAENGTTYIKVNATDPNLPGLLYVEAPKYD